MAYTRKLATSYDFNKQLDEDLSSWIEYFDFKQAIAGVNDKVTLCAKLNDLLLRIRQYHADNAIKNQYILDQIQAFEASANQAFRQESMKEAYTVEDFGLNDQVDFATMPTPSSSIPAVSNVLGVKPNYEAEYGTHSPESPRYTPSHAEQATGLKIQPELYESKQEPIDRLVVTPPFTPPAPQDEQIEASASIKPNKPSFWQRFKNMSTIRKVVTVVGAVLLLGGLAAIGLVTGGVAIPFLGAGLTAMATSGGVASLGLLVTAGPMITNRSNDYATVNHDEMPASAPASPAGNTDSMIHQRLSVAGLQALQTPERKQAVLAAQAQNPQAVKAALHKIRDTQISAPVVTTDERPAGPSSFASRM
jgi:hypothetical protein